jgi:hypothetical protein
MRIYAERPGRVALQLLADALVVGWTVAVVALARAAHGRVLGLQVPGQRLTGAGEAIRGAFDGAAGTAGRVPLVGDDLARALGTGTGAGEALASAGRDVTAAAGAAGVAAAVLLLAVGIVPVVTVWLALRVRWVRLAGSARAARVADPDLLALRALAGRPARRLLAVTPDPAGAWRRGDPAAVAALAALELRALGLRDPEPGPDVTR